MALIAAVPALSTTTAPPQRIVADLLLVPFFESEPVDALFGLDEAARGEIARALGAGEFRGKPDETFVTPHVTGWAAPRVLLIGAGQRTAFTTERLRRLSAAAALAARQRRAKRAALLVRGDAPAAAAVQAVAEGLILAAFSGDRYKGERGAPPIEELIIAAPGETETTVEAAARRGQILGESCNIARDLANEPSNVLTPNELANRARAIATAAGLAVDVLDEHEIERLKMGLLLGVARGSAEPPRVIVLRHEPATAPAAPVLGLVGKGITFDTGGISIKPADGMERMKTDMSGGAAVIAAMRAISLLNAPIRVVGIVPATENMPGGRAIKPGDVIH